MKTFIFIVVITGLGFFIPFLIKLNKERKQDNAAEANRSPREIRNDCLAIEDKEEQQQCLFDTNNCAHMDVGEKRQECYDLRSNIVHDFSDITTVEKEPVEKEPELIGDFATAP